MRGAACWAAATIAAVFGGGCGGGGEVGLGQVEQDIKRDYQKQIDAQIQKAGGGTKVTIDSVDCVKQSDEKGRCFAVVSGDVEGRRPIAITFGQDGEYLWEVDSSGDLGISAAAPTPAKPQTGQGSATGDESGVDADVAALLAAYKAASLPVSDVGDSDGAHELSVDDVTVYVFGEEAEARTEGAAIKGVIADNPGRGAFKQTGNLVFFLGQERNLTRNERGLFRQVVATGEAAVGL